MGFKKERKHINLVGTRTVGRKTAKVGARAKHHRRTKRGTTVKPGRPGRP
jgi:hypothetical protein